jgi:hypothetical protein
LSRYRILRVVTAVAALTATVLSTPPAQAATLPNLVAVATPDMHVAVTFAAYATPYTQADAGAFSTMMITQYGMIGIPNYDPTAQSDSQLVCYVNMNASELVAVYGIVGQGVYEAGSVCSGMASGGYPVRWS